MFLGSELPQTRTVLVSLEGCIDVRMPEVNVSLAACQRTTDECLQLIAVAGLFNDIIEEKDRIS